MKKILMTFASAAMLAGAASAGAAQSNDTAGRYWLHPKQGMIKLAPAGTGATPTSVAQDTNSGQERTAGKASASSANTGTYKWLHPKLGMVTVDRATNAMVIGKSLGSTAAAP